MKKNKNLDINSLYEFESYILSSMLNEPTVIDEVLSKLQNIDFYNEFHCMLFDVIKNIYRQGKLVEALSVIEYIKNNNEIVKNFPNYNQQILTLSSIYTDSVKLDSYIDFVKNASIKRQADDFAQKIINDGLDYTKFKEKTENWISEFTSILNSKKDDKITWIKEVADEFYKNLSKLTNRKTYDLTGTDSGFPLINKYTDGFQRGELIILAARPGTGKTALAINFALNAAKRIKEDNTNKSGKKGVVVMFSIEMSKNQIMQRMMSCECSIDLSSIKNGRLTDDNNETIEQEYDEISSLPIIIDDRSDLSVFDIQAKLKQIAADNDVRLVIVDYLQLIKGVNEKFYITNRQQEVSNISRMLKLISRNINTPLIALAQLSRKIEERKKSNDENARPILSDLRESGSIEQDADLVTFLYIKNQNTQNNQDSKTKIPYILQPITYIIEKNRNGSTGEINLIFNKTFGQFIPDTSNYNKEE